MLIMMARLHQRDKGGVAATVYRLLRSPCALVRNAVGRGIQGHLQRGHQGCRGQSRLLQHPVLQPDGWIRHLHSAPLSAVRYHVRCVMLTKVATAREEREVPWHSDDGDQHQAERAA